MAVYTTIFLCAEEKLKECFPGWKPALPQPVRRTITDPFTGEER
jgi:hypothetical protein